MSTERDETETPENAQAEALRTDHRPHDVGAVEAAGFEFEDAWEYERPEYAAGDEGSATLPSPRASDAHRNQAESESEPNPGASRRMESGERGNGVGTADTTDLAGLTDPSTFADLSALADADGLGDRSPALLDTVS